MRLRGFWRVPRRTVANWRCPFTPGGPSSRPCVNPHWREAISLRDLRDALPPPPDAQEPHAHSHGREALPCKLPRRPSRARPPPKDGAIPEYEAPHSCFFLFPSVKNVTCTSDTRVSCGCTSARSTAPSPTPRLSIAGASVTSPQAWPAPAEAANLLWKIRIFHEQDV